MKKLLFVLLVVALASFLVVGCMPVTPGEGEGEGEGEAEICPTVAVESQVAVGGFTYIKGGTAQTITVTFAVPTEPVSVYVGLPCNEKALPEGVPDDSAEVIMYTTDNLTYTGTYTFSGDCCEGYIYVLTCDTCAPCKYPYIVDSEPPYATIEVCIDACVCEGCELSFTSTITEDCVDEVNCDDDCSGFASWSIDIYDDDPFDECCEIPCAEPIDSGSGTACPVSWTTTECFETGDTVYVVVTLVDNVGNDTKFGGSLTGFNSDTCDAVTLTSWPDDDCVDTADFVYCDDIVG